MERFVGNLENNLMALRKAGCIVGKYGYKLESRDSC
jgi:hypothetical protein